MGGPIFRIVFALYTGSGGPRRSGELFPWGMLPKGTRAGILEGVLPPAVDIELARGLRVTVPVGVFAPERGGGCPLIVLPPCWLGGAGLMTLAAGGGHEGVFDLGGADFALDAASSSRYGSPCTRNGRPYSSSQLSKVFFRSASILGRSLAILFLIFSSRSRRVGSRFSPLVPRPISREAS